MEAPAKPALSCSTSLLVACTQGGEFSPASNAIWAMHRCVLSASWRSPTLRLRKSTAINLRMSSLTDPSFRDHSRACSFLRVSSACFGFGILRHNGSATLRSASIMLCGSAVTSHSMTVPPEAAGAAETGVDEMEFGALRTPAGGGAVAGGVGVYVVRGDSAPPPTCPIVSA